MVVAYLTFVGQDLLNIKIVMQLSIRMSKRGHNCAFLLQVTVLPFLPLTVPTFPSAIDLFYQRPDRPRRIPRISVSVLTLECLIPFIQKSTDYV